MNNLGRIAYTLMFLIFGELSTPTPPKPDSLPVDGASSVFAQQIDTTIIKECGLNFRIFDFSCTASNNFTIPVNSVPGTQMGQDVVLEEIRLIIDHDWNADLDIFLRSPSGVWVEVSTDNGGASNDYGDPTDLSCNSVARISMTACTSVLQGEGPFLGNFFPEGNFNDFNDGSNPNGDWVLQLCDDALGDQGTLKSVQLVFTDQTFRQATSIQSDTIASNYVDLNWVTNNPSCASTLIEYGPPGFIPGTGNLPGQGTLVSVACPVSMPYRLNGLAEFTDYDLYIRESDGNGNFSLNSCPFSFTTECTTAPITLQETFDTQADCGQDCGNTCPLTGVWKNVADDDFDWLINQGETSTSETGPSDDITGGGQYLYVETSRRDCRSGARAALESNCLEINANAGQCHLSFYYHLFGAAINGLELAISTDNGMNWTTLWSRYGQQGDRWIKNYIDLSAYDGQVARFRLIGLGGDNRLGDLAIDDIRFYGTTDLGDSPYVFYEDIDEDGFGDPSAPVKSCENVIPIGTVADSTDCDDSNASIYPNAPEILCNGVDENCNGPADDKVLPDPTVSNQLVCQGDPLTLNLSNPLGSYYWFAEQHDTTPVYVGNSFSLPQTDSSSIYFVMDSIPPSCGSERVAIAIQVNPVPELLVNVPDPICQGTSFDLVNLAVADALQLDGEISYHSGSPAIANNELPNSVVSPQSNTTYFIKKTTTDGCTAEIQVDINVFPAPEMTFSPGPVIPLCIRESSVVTVSPAANVLTPVSFRWSNGIRGEQVELFASRPGQSDTYYVTITDARGCTQVDSVTINTANSVSSVSVDAIAAVSSCGGNDGSITLSPLDGTGPFDYSWDGPVSGTTTGISGTYQIPNLLQGVYRVTIVDQAPPACSFVLPIIVVNGPAVIVDPNVQIQQESCFGANDGSINLTVFANNPQYEWSNGHTTEDLNNVGAGIYSVTITDGSCSVTLDDLQIESPPALTVEVFDILVASCPGHIDGKIDITVQGGLKPYTFSWSNTAGSEDLMNVAAGLYSVTVTDANNCLVELNTIQLGHKPTLTIIPLETKSPRCTGEESGLIRVDAVGGSSPYRYQWSSGLRSPILAGVPAGQYTLTLTDASGCTDVHDFLIEDAQPIALADQTTQLPSCNGLADGAIRLEAMGGTGPYTYLWSDGAMGPERTLLGEGTYSCEIRDANDCVLNTGQIDLVAPVSLIIQDLFPQGSSCLGVNDGFIDVEISGGTPPYRYEWSHGDSIADPMNLPAGYYTLTVTDQNGCFLVTPAIEVVQFEPLAVTIELAVNPSCGNAEDGLIEVRTESLSMPVTYKWNNGETTEDLRNLGVGIYTCTITDAAGCLFFLDTITLTAPPPLVVNIIDTENPSCAGLPEGVVTVEVSGGIPPYTYHWTNGDTTKNLSRVEAGNYRLLVLDASPNVCSMSSEWVTIEEPDELDIEIVDIVPTGCKNISGSIEVRPIGGTPPYNIIWSTQDTTFLINDLAPGDYGLTLTDALGCIRLQSSLTIFTTPEEFEIQVLDKIDVSCSGQADGSIVPFPLGGQGPYQFNWSNASEDSINTDLPSGIYSLTMTDRNGCTGVVNDIVIQTTPPIQYQVVEVQDALCYEEASGAIRLAVNGGTAPYQIDWNHNDTGLVVDELPMGQYEFTITDARGCQQISLTTLEVKEPDHPLAIGQLLLDSATCAGIDNGAARLMITGGTAPYQFLWSTGDTTNFAEGLAAGSMYSCTVSDANACELEIRGVVVPAPQVLTVSYEMIPARVGQSNGRVAAIPDGGSPPYQYRWDLGTAFSSDSMVSGLSAGTYAFTLTDANFCSLEDSVIIEENLSNATTDLSQQVMVRLFPNPALSTLDVNVWLQGKVKGKINLQVIGVDGRVVHQQTAIASPDIPIVIAKKLPVGLYFVKIEFEAYKRAVVRKLVVVN